VNLAWQVGFYVAALLFVAGLTGAAISWEHELDAWLNPSLYMAETVVGDFKMVA
jgi:uncharacterized iron-regulated membrane protein